jgi:glycine hydroxymethyltransferase
MIMVTNKGLKKDPELGDKINKAIFPGLQGGPHDNQTAGIAVALFEAAQPSFKKYAAQIVKNSKALAKTLMDGGLKLVGGGSENHLLLVNLTSVLGAGSGVFAQKALDRVGLTLNKNTVPDETSSPFYPSGIRLGTPASTSRGMKEKEMKFIGRVILEVINLLKPYRLPAKKPSFAKASEGKEERKDYIAKFEKEMRANKKMKEIHVRVKKLALDFSIP